MKGRDNLLFISEVQEGWIPASLVIVQSGHLVISGLTDACAVEKGRRGRSDPLFHDYGSRSDHNHALADPMGMAEG